MGKFLQYLESPHLEQGVDKKTANSPFPPSPVAGRCDTVTQAVCQKTQVGVTSVHSDCAFPGQARSAEPFLLKFCSVFSWELSTAEAKRLKAVAVGSAEV